MRVALFITCFNDTLFPSAGRAVVEVLERVGCAVEFPLEQTCCGQMHVNSGYEHEAVGLMSRFARVFSGYDAVVSPSASCVAHVRERIPDAPHVFELTEFLIDRAGRGRRRRVVPAPRDAAPDVPLAAAAGDRRPAAAAAGGGARDRPGRAGGRARVLRVRRDVRDQERRHVDGDALRQGPARAGHARGGLHLGRHVVPDAHRRRAVARPHRACGRCTWRRSWRRRNELSDPQRA